MAIAIAASCTRRFVGCEISCRLMVIQMGDAASIVGPSVNARPE